MDLSLTFYATDCCTCGRSANKSISVSGSRVIICTFASNSISGCWSKCESRIASECNHGTNGIHGTIRNTTRDCSVCVCWLGIIIAYAIKKV